MGAITAAARRLLLARGLLPRLGVTCRLLLLLLLLSLLLLLPEAVRVDGYVELVLLGLPGPQAQGLKQVHAALGLPLSELQLALLQQQLLSPQLRIHALLSVLLAQQSEAKGWGHAAGPSQLAPGGNG